MRKIRSLVVAFVAMLVLGGSVFASSISTTTYIGVADFTNAGTVTFSFVLKNVSGNGNVADKTIRWSTAAFNIGSNDNWVRADQYAVVTAKIEKAGVNVYMYQTNLNSTNYKPKNSSGTVLYRGNYVSSGTAWVWVSSAASGLVRQNIKYESANSGDYRCYIPIAYSLVAKSSPTITFDGTDRIWTRTDGTGAAASTIAVRTDRFLCDVADSSAAKTDGKGYPNGKGHYTKIASFGGPVFGSDYKANQEPIDWGSADVQDNTAYMYFFGNFKNIMGKDVYGTDQLHVVQVTE